MTANFRCYFYARTVSVFGDWMLPVALAAAVLDEGHGTTGVGLVLAAPMLAWVLIMLFTGVLADRIGARPLMVAADAVRFLTQASLAVLLLTAHPPLWLIVALQLCYGFANAAFQPGIGSLMPRIVDDVQRGNSRVSAAEAVMVTVGPAAAGLILVVTGPSVVLLIDSLTFLVSGWLLFRLRLATTDPPTVRQSMLRSAMDGWREFVARPWLWPVILTFCLFGLLVFGPFVVLSASGLTSDHGSTGYGVVMAVGGIGAVTGGWLAGRLRPRYPMRVALLALSLVAWPMVALAAGAPLALIAIAFFLSSLGRSAWAVLWTSTEQTQVPAEILNRVYAFDVVGSIALIPVGRALSGPVSSDLGYHTTLYGCAAVAVVGCVVMAALPAVRNLQRRRAGDEHVSTGDRAAERAVP